MDYYYLANSTYINGTIYWTIQSTTGNEYSIKNFFTRVSTYMDNNLLGINGTNGDDTFGRALISVLIIVLVTGGLTYRYGIQNEAVILGFLFGIVMLLDNMNFIPDLPSSFGINVDVGKFLTFVVALLAITMIIREEMQ